MSNNPALIKIEFLINNLESKIFIYWRKYINPYNPKRKRFFKKKKYSMYLIFANDKILN